MFHESAAGALLRPAHGARRRAGRLRHFATLDMAHGPDHVLIGGIAGRGTIVNEAVRRVLAAEAVAVPAALNADAGPGIIIGDIEHADIAHDRSTRDARPAPIGVVDL